MYDSTHIQDSACQVAGSGVVCDWKANILELIGGSPCPKPRSDGRGDYGM